MEDAKNFCSARNKNLCSKEELCEGDAIDREVTDPIGYQQIDAYKNHPPQSQWVYLATDEVLQIGSAVSDSFCKTHFELHAHYIKDSSEGNWLMSQEPLPGRYFQYCCETGMYNLLSLVEGVRYEHLAINRVSAPLRQSFFGLRVLF